MKETESNDIIWLKEYKRSTSSSSSSKSPSIPNKAIRRNSNFIKDKNSHWYKYNISISTKNSTLVLKPLYKKKAVISPSPNLSSTLSLANNDEIIIIDLQFISTKKLDDKTFQVLQSINVQKIRNGINGLKKDNRKNNDRLFKFKFENETVMNHWFDKIMKSMHDSLINDSNSISHDNTSNNIISKNTINNDNNNKDLNNNKSTTTTTTTTTSGTDFTSLLNQVKHLHQSNLKCCDCNSTDSVEWISLNILCLLCIKCSGIHRSMGSHISKIRSLTLDNFHSIETLYLIKNNCLNSNVNEIYEHNLPINLKISSNCNDQMRSLFIKDKYITKKYIEKKLTINNDNDILKDLILAIHNNSIYDIQKALAKTNRTLRELSIYHRKTNTTTSIFQYSLKHHTIVDETPIFHITEFLLSNGLIIDQLPTNMTQWGPEVIKYWKAMLKIYEPYKESSPLPSSFSSSSPSSSSFSKGNIYKSPLAQKSLQHTDGNHNHILQDTKSIGKLIINNNTSIPSSTLSSPFSPATRNLMSPNNILNLHKSLKLNKKR
ncbi:GTPase-activating protein AGE1 NDAI_0F04530 [Naumovozyma dairenensis CBS 421]|uniref:ADP-ribosylation factor GTPase-activating protein n=1 Tax=Naumovozyma dairenensis (strain ATCC 10597 / BCRC 20456 / CBS 421 / NBRC 0211 / NRRL Y-12639) TaxID=1071378 RepID=G0WDB0_NAUDC|nr:hypothetical protein NDAI_0F04530 [Naumovozyma dairenensis CBS 421]CCD25771.1 hypothetical protein NDAI_0F04530 [Naumovozyma dairenensis CBS 421]